MPLTALLLVVAGLCLAPVEETDLFFRMAAGEQFLRTGHVLHHNLFSFTYPDAPYLDSAWLFDAGVAGLFRLGSFPAIVLGKTALLLGLAVAAYRVCRAGGASALLSAAVLAVAFLCMRERLVERPHLFSLLGEVALLALLPSIAQAGPRRWLLFPLTILWVNFHAGAFLAAGLLALAGLGALADRRPRREAMRLFLFAAAATACLACSPVGAGIFRYLTFHVGVFDLHPVDEFRNATWRSDAPFIVFALAAAALVLRARQSWLGRFPAFGIALLGLWQVRFSADAVLVLALVSAPALESLVGRFVAESRLARGIFAVGAAGLTLIPRIAGASHGGAGISLQAIDLDRGSLPSAALQFVEEHGLREHMYNDFETGSYLLWQGFPRYRVFVDPRLPAYPVSFHRLLGRMDISRPEWTAAMDALGVDSALLDYAGINRRVAFWDPEAWALVFRAQDARVFVRRLPRWTSLIAAYEIPASFDFTVENGATTRVLASPPAGSPVPACEWQFRRGDLYFDLEGAKSMHAVDAYRAALAEPAGGLPAAHELSAASWIGSIDVAAGRFAEALPPLERALALAPDDPAVLTQRALALDGVGRASEARDTWKRIAALQPSSPLGKRAAERATR